MKVTFWDKNSKCVLITNLEVVPRIGERVCIARGYPTRDIARINHILDSGTFGGHLVEVVLDYEDFNGIPCKWEAYVRGITNITDYIHNRQGISYDILKGVVQKLVQFVDRSCDLRNESPVSIAMEMYSILSETSIDEVYWQEISHMVVDFVKNKK